MISPPNIFDHEIIASQEIMEAIMKKLFLSLALIFMSSFCFANDDFNWNTDPCAADLRIMIDALGKQKMAAKSQFKDIWVSADYNMREYELTMTDGCDTNFYLLKFSILENQCHNLISVELLHSNG